MAFARWRAVSSRQRVQPPQRSLRPATAWGVAPRRTFANAAAGSGSGGGGGGMLVFDRTTKLAQRHRAASAALNRARAAGALIVPPPPSASVGAGRLAGSEYDYLRDEIADRMVDRVIVRSHATATLRSVYCAVCSPQF